MATYVISVPPSVNNLYVNLRKGGRVKSRHYGRWIDNELKALTWQKAKPIAGRATVTITFPENKRRDADGYLKPVLDLLVRAGILADDRCDYVSSVTASFSKAVELCHVQIEGESA